MAKDPSKTEKATPRRLNKTREEGNVWKSQELTKTMGLISGLVALTLWLGFIGTEMGILIRYFLSTALTSFSPTPAGVMELFQFVSISIAKMLLPILFIIGLVAFVVLRVQVGKLWTTKVFEPKLSKFNPISGLKRMFFSLGTWGRMAKSVLHAIFIGFAPWLVIRKEMENFSSLYEVSAEGLTVYILTLGLKVVLYALVPMICLTVFDYFWSKYQYAENIKMTKDEIKDEQKMTEGDPQIKQKQRQKMMQVMGQRMMQQVPKADVIITNPTHLAIAIRYNSLEAPAPVVLAKGADKVAEKIREIAREHNIPIRENKPLARALYKQVQIGDMIPEELYQAVAAILAQIWKTRPQGTPSTTIALPKK